MGVDIFGRQPTAEVGKYFCRNYWWWRPLWEYVEIEHPDLAGKVTYTYTDDGDGLDASDSLQLARLLREELADGTVAHYVKDRDEYIAALPLEPCSICDATGKRAEAVAASLGKPGEPCKGCSGKGWVRSGEAWYGLCVRDIEEFAEFLAASGGFDLS